ncbi:MAG: hypothetical protein WAO69_11715, partial [Aestuariivita sp.]
KACALPSAKVAARLVPELCPKSPTDFDTADGQGDFPKNRPEPGWQDIGAFARNGSMKGGGGRRSSSQLTDPKRE